VIQPTLTSTNAGRFRPASPPTGETVDTWLVAFVSLVFFVILSAKAPMAWGASYRRIVASSVPARSAIVSSVRKREGEDRAAERKVL
jgi:hypothetical protein